jgi:hypothetical protein
MAVSRLKLLPQSFLCPFDGINIVPRPNNWLGIVVSICCVVVDGKSEVSVEEYYAQEKRKERNATQNVDEKKP